MFHLNYLNYLQKRCTDTFEQSSITQMNSCEEKEENEKKEEKNKGEMAAKHPSDGAFPPKAIYRSST